MSTPETSAPAEIGIAEAAERFMALSEGPKPKPTANNPPEAAAEVEEAEATAGEAEETYSDSDEAPEVQAEGSQDEDAAEQAGEDEENTGQDLDPDTLVTVKVGGKTMQVKLREALNGYQRLSDYSRNMETVRQERLQVEAAKQEIGQAEERYRQLLPALEQQLMQLMPQEPNWAELHAKDPINFPLYEKQWRDHQERLAAIRSEQHRLASDAAEKEASALRKMVEDGRKQLLDRVPEWRDQDKWEKARQGLREYGRKIGYSDEELSQAYDPRAVIVLDKARKYDELMANRPKPQHPGQNAPKPMKTGSTAAIPRQNTQFNKARERLKSSGKVEDAAALFGLLGSRR